MKQLFKEIFNLDPTEVEEFITKIYGRFLEEIMAN